MSVTIYDAFLQHRVVDIFFFSIIGDMLNYCVFKPKRYK